MRKLTALCGAVAADAVRRKIVWVVLLFAAVLAFAVPSLPSYGIGVDVAIFREVSIALTWLAAIVVSVALAAPRVPAEVERRTVYSILGRDVRRWQYLLGTWAGIALVMAAVVIAFVLVTIAVGWLRYGSPELRLFEAGLAIWLESIVVAAFAIAVSTVTGTATTVIATVAFLFVGHAYRSLLPEALATWAPTLDTFNVINPVAHGDGLSAPYALVMAAAGAAWVVALLVAGTLVFDRRDL